MPEKSIIYLDNSATTPVCPEAVQKAVETMTLYYGNPSSLHTMGVEAENILNQARVSIARCMGAAPEEITFTSGGTESNNIAVIGVAHALKRRGKRIVTTLSEHASIEGPFDQLEAEGFEVIRLRPSSNGSVTAEQIYEAVNPDTILVTMMLVNNETGAIQPVEAIKRAVTRSAAPALIHCDAVQAFCKVPIKVSKLGADLITVSSHKIHGPKGAGALYIRKGVRLLPLYSGGGQEKKIRPGTEPVPAIAAFGEAARIAFDSFEQNMEQIRALRERCINKFKALPFEGITVNSPLDGAPHILNISTGCIRSETMIHFLSELGIYVSGGSACSKGARSHVLSAMGLSDRQIDSALRISFSRYNTAEDVDALVKGIERGIKQLTHFK